MEQKNYQQSNSSTELDVKGILKDLAVGVVAGLIFIVICGFGELVADFFMK